MRTTVKGLEIGDLCYQKAALLSLQVPLYTISVHISHCNPCERYGRGYVVQSPDQGLPHIADGLPRCDAILIRVSRCAASMARCKDSVVSDGTRGRTSAQDNVARFDNKSQDRPALPQVIDAKQELASRGLTSLSQITSAFYNRSAYPE